MARHPSLPGPYEAIHDTDITPRDPLPTEAGAPQPPPVQPASYFGQERAAGPVDGLASRGEQAGDSGDAYELNFENAPIATVAKVVLGDLLRAGYVIDPRVQGTVTLSSGRPVPRKDLVFVLESVLQMSSVALVRDGEAYRLLPTGEAKGSASVGNGTLQGYGLTVVPLRYVSAETILKLLDSFAVKTGMARADAGRNLILLQGTGPERRGAIETVMSFDVDWMRGQSVGIYPVQFASPEAMISELEKILENGEGGLNHSLVTLQPVSRLNAVLVVAKKPQLLETAATWIARLDKTNNAGSAVRVYRLRYGSASQVAKLMNKIFSAQPGDSFNSELNQIAPGAGAASTSSNGQQGAQPFDSSRTGSGSTPRSTGLQVGTTGRSDGWGTGSSSGGGMGGGDDFASKGFRSAVTTTTENVSTESTQTDRLIGSARITADVVNNALIIFANQETYRLIEQTLAQIDRPQMQVAVHATIAEVTLNNSLQYGVQYFVQSSDLNMGHDNGSIGLVNGAAEAILNRALPGFNLVLGPESSPRVILDALRNITDVKVLSSPSVMVMDNQTATLQVGDEVPITTQSATIITNPENPVVNTIDYRNTGVILQVQPRINANGTVLLEIEQEISNVVNNKSADSLTPTLSKRRVKSSIGVTSGQSVLLGGLISETHERGRQGIPILEELPLVGDAFSHNTRNTTRTELIIFIQPQIIRDGIDAYKVAEELRAKLRGSAEASFPPGPSLRRDPQFAR